MKKSFKQKFYEFMDDEYGLYYMSPFIDEISHFLERNKENYFSVLDFGCGYGKLSNVFFQSGYKVTGVDMDAERINDARIKYSQIDFLNYKYKDSLPFENNSFDVIFSSSVLQYIDHDVFFTECLRVLKRGGCIIFIENLKNNPITRIGRAYLKLKKFDYHSYPWNHLNLKEIQEMERFFNLITVRPYHFLGPLLYVSGFKKIKSVIKVIDMGLLKFGIIKRLSWLSLIIGKK